MRSIPWLKGCFIFPFFLIQIGLQGAVTVTALSDPTGIVAKQESADTGTVRTLVAPEVDGEHSFGYWESNGNRLATADGTIREIVQVTIGAVDITYTARYFKTTDDTDGDGLPDWYEQRISGNLAMTADGDPDGDGFSNLLEYQRNLNPMKADENIEGGTSIRNSNALSFADKSLGLYLDESTDDDNDSLPDRYEIKQFGNLSENAGGDTDGDGFSNLIEYQRGMEANRTEEIRMGGTSVRNSNILNFADRSLGLWLGENADDDNDSIPDLYELKQFDRFDYGANDDTDGDGFSNLREYQLGMEANRSEEITSGGTSIRNSNILSFSDMSLGLYIDESIDDDNDSLPDRFEIRNFGGLSESATGDFDGDGFSNLREYQLGMEANRSEELVPGGTSIRNSNILTVTLLTDSDGDGLPDSVETNTGVYVSATDTGTDPNNVDSDGDGMSDNEELSIGKNPNLPYDWKQIVAIDDSNFHAAINLWFDNQPEANATYGHISDWNTSAITDMSNAFDGRTTFNEDIGRWDVSNVRNMTMMFNEAEAFNQDIGNWDVSSVLHMYRIFRHAISFNQDIGDWDVSSVITLSAAFEHASSFDQDLSNWDTSSVTHLSAVFNNAVSFNHSVNDWDTSAALNMTNTFRNARSFNHGLSNWDTSRVTSMDQMFEGAFLFDQDLSDWNISSVTNMHNIFAATHALSNSNKGLIHQAFSTNPNWPYDWRQYVVIDDSNFQTAVNLWFDNQTEANATYGHISDWNTSSVTDMSSAFKGRSNFNEDISGWDVSQVDNMSNIFQWASSFNQDLSKWDISSVSNLSGMFANASSFDHPISDWNTSAVVKMSYLFFKASSFNQSIGNWNVSKVTNMYRMFAGASSFNQDLSKWDISSASNLNGMFFNASSFNQSIHNWDVSLVNIMSNMFDGASSLSNSQKGQIHKSFSSNQNWPYDWAEYDNTPPHSLTLSDSNFSENLPIGSIIGTFSAIDSDINATLTYSLKDASSSYSYNLFTLEENGTLFTAGAFDYETNASAYNLIVRATDEYGTFIEGNFTLFLLDENETIDLDPDHNQTTPSTDHNTTDPGIDQNTTTPGIIDNNSTVPVVTNGTIVVVDQNGTLPHDQNTTTPHPTPEPEYFRPLVRTGEASAITSSSATLSGIIIDDGNSTISEKGILLSTHPLPQLGHPRTQILPIDENSSAFELTIDQLEPDTTYFFRAYAINGVGTSVGTIESFETSMEGIGPHWIDALPISDAENWWSNLWLGNFYIAENNGWIMHEDLGWLFVLGQPDQSIWLWKEEMGWLWTNSETYPFLYSNQSNGWLFYHGQLDGIGLFYDYDANRWQVSQ